MAGLRLYQADDFKVEVAFGSRPTQASAFTELIATAWEESDEDAPTTQVTALNNRRAQFVGQRPIQTVAITMDAAQLSSPAMNRLIKESEDDNTIYFRVTAPKETIKSASASLTLAVARNTGAGTLAGSDAAGFYTNDEYVQGIWAAVGSARAALASKSTGPNASTWRGVSAGTPAAGLTPYSIDDGGPGTAITAGNAELFYPGVVRPIFGAKVTSGGALGIRTGEQAATVFNIAPNSRLRQPVFTV